MKRLISWVKDFGQSILSSLTPGVLSGLLLISFGFLVLMVPEILVALVASFFILGGLLLLPISRPKKVRTYRTYTYDEPIRVRFF